MQLARSLAALGSTRCRTHSLSSLSEAGDGRGGGVGQFSICSLPLPAPQQGATEGAGRSNAAQGCWAGSGVSLKEPGLRSSTSRTPRPSPRTWLLYEHKSNSTCPCQEDCRHEEGTFKRTRREQPASPKPFASENSVPSHAGHISPVRASRSADPALHQLPLREHSREHPTLPPSPRPLQPESPCPTSCRAPGPTSCPSALGPSASGVTSQTLRDFPSGPQSLRTLPCGTCTSCVGSPWTALWHNHNRVKAPVAVPELGGRRQERTHPLGSGLDA